MKAVILAAGIGSRLGRPYPKCLSVLPYGETIIKRQVRILQENGIFEIIVVVGFKLNLIIEAVTDVFLKYNPEYYITNTAKSLLHGIKNISDDIIWLNGDVVFDEKIIGKIVNSNGNVVGGNSAKCGEEEVKYRLGHDGNIISISKNIMQANGEAIGINKIAKKDLHYFTTKLDECDDNDYFEKAIEKAIEDGIIFKVVNIDEFKCIEVDFRQDWELASNMFKEK